MFANRMTRRPLASASVSAHLNDLTTHSGTLLTHRVITVNLFAGELEGVDRYQPRVGEQHAGGGGDVEAVAQERLRPRPARIAHTRTTVGRSSSSRLSRWADVTARPARPRPAPRPRQRDARTDRHRAREQVEQDVQRVEDAAGQKRLDALVEQGQRRRGQDGEQGQRRDGQRPQPKAALPIGGEEGYGRNLSGPGRRKGSDG